MHHMPHVAGPLRRTLAAIHALREPPTCIVATGDLTESGALEEYRRLRDILSESEIPVYLLAGNHDRRGMLRAVFSHHAYMHETPRALQYTIESELLRVIALDSSEPPRRGGYLDEERLTWLHEALRARPRTRTILALHHPPFQTQVGAFDAQPFAGRERLGEIVRENPQIARIICGHVHQMLWRPWCGTVAVSAPSTAPTLALHSRGVLRWEPGGFLLHRYDWNADVTTQLVRVSSEPIAVGA